MLAKTESQFDQAWNLLDVVAKAEAQINAAATAAGPIAAEIGEDSTGNWYLIQTFAGDERRTLRHLARRRFAVFLAMRPRDDNDGFGAERTAPGWLLVYVFDIEKMRARLLATPGVTGILYDPKTQAPMVIDQDFVDTAKGLHWQVKHRQSVNVPDANPQKLAQPRRPTKRERKCLDQLKKAMKVAGIVFNMDQWEFMNRLVPRLRIALMEHVLRASTVSPSGSA